MRQRQNSRLRDLLIAAAIMAALLLVANPELRALLLLTDSLGLELVALLLATQLKSGVYVLLPAANAVAGFLCVLAVGIGQAAVGVPEVTSVAAVR